MREKRGRVIGAALWVCALSHAAYADDVSVRARVDRTQVSLNDPVELSIEVSGTQRAQAPDVQVGGFTAQYVGPSTQVSIINGQVSSSITHTYLLTPQREGTWTVGPIEVQAGGKTYRTDPITVEVGPAGSRPRQLQPPSSGDEQPEEPPAPVGGALQLQIGVDRTKAYVNQAIPARIQFLVGGVAVRGVDMPTLQAEGFLIKPVKQPTQSQVMVGGQPYTLLQFDTDIVPIKPGTLTLGPAAITCQVAQRRRARRRRASPFGRDPFDEVFDGSLFDDFFGQTLLTPATVTSDPVTIEVLPLPEEGKPSDFHGAVGQFTLEASAVPTTLAVGEPVTVTMRVRGAGNQDSISPPAIPADPSQFKVYDPQQKSQPQSAGAAREKVFEQVLIPLAPSVKEIPPIRFSCFDPIRGRYETLTQGPIPLAVKPAPVEPKLAVVEPRAAVAPAAQPEALGRDIVYIKEGLGAVRPVGWRWYRSGRIGWLIAPVLLLGLSEAIRRWRERLAADPSLARASGALRRAMARCQAAKRLAQQGKVSDAYAELFRAIQQYAGDRWNVASEGLTRVELERHARARGVPEEILRDALVCVERCDAARFAPASVASNQLDSTREMTASFLKRLERWKP